jgi:hypothetical protein
MLFSEDKEKINFQEILTLGKFDMSEDELTNISHIFTKVKLKVIKDLLYKSKDTNHISKISFLEVKILNPVFRYTIDNF